MSINAWLIYNTCLHSEQYLSVYDLYVEAAKKFDVTLSLKRNDEIYTYIDDDGVSLEAQSPDFVIFLDKDIRLARQLELYRIPLFNSANAIEICDDKIYTMQSLCARGLKMPKSIFSYLSYNNECANSERHREHIMRELTFPLVLKEAFGSFGQQVYLIHNENELVKKQAEISNKAYMVQEYIKSSHGRDVRIYVVGGKVVGSMLRQNANDFRANASNGGVCSAYQPSKEFCDMAIRAAEILKLDFCGVDIMFGENEEPILCEVNSGAHIKNMLEVSGINIAEHIIQYILERVNVRRSFNIH